MDAVNLTPQIEDLEANIDELEDALEPLLRSSLVTTASSLPLLDKAKLYVLSSYAIESLIFSTLLASDVNARDHPIFAELARLKGYFKKIKDAELGPVPKARLDKDAAARFIKHGLAGNDKYDIERAERIAKEKAKASLKARQLHIKFDEAEENAKMEKLPKKRTVEEIESDEEEEVGQEVNDVDSENEGSDGGNKGDEKDAVSAEPAQKKRRVSGTNMNGTDSPISPSPSSASKREKKKRLSKHKTPTASGTDDDSGVKSKKERNTEGKAQRREQNMRRRGSKAEMVLPEKEAPRTHSETFKALLEGPLKKKEKKGKGK